MCSFPVDSVSKPRFDVAVVGSGPGGSVAALILARGGASVALIDKARAGRDKACGDLVGPRALALLSELGLTPPSGHRVSDMMILGPTGRQVVLPAKAGLTYPGYGLSITRVLFDAWLHHMAIDAGATPITARVARLAGPSSVELDNGSKVHATVVIGADGAGSVVASSAGLIDRARVLWGFAYRGYVSHHIDRPVIALWDETPRRGFPGYGWIFPSDDATANIGLGIGLGADRRSASRAVEQFDAFCVHLRNHGMLTGDVPAQRIGGWLKMGMVGTVPARDRVLLVGDAAGLVNPLQGEGIAPAMTSAATAAHAILADPSTAAHHYRQHLAATTGAFAGATAPIHALVSSRPERVAVVARALTAPIVRNLIAPPWALLWNDLYDGAPPGPNKTAVRAALKMARAVGRRSTVARNLKETLEPMD
jgi:menaquinone-9 beta-reductase